MLSSVMQPSPRSSVAMHTVQCCRAPGAPCSAARPTTPNPNPNPNPTPNPNPNPTPTPTPTPNPSPHLVLRGLQLAPGQQQREGALGEALLQPPHVPAQRLAARGAHLRLVRGRVRARVRGRVRVRVRVRARATGADLRLKGIELVRQLLDGGADREELERRQGLERLAARRAQLRRGQGAGAHSAR